MLTPRHHMMVKIWTIPFDDEVNNDEVAPEPPTNDVNINANYDDEKNYYKVNPDKRTNGVNIETIYNDSGGNIEE